MYGLIPRPSRRPGYEAVCEMHAQDCGFFSVCRELHVADVGDDEGSYSYSVDQGGGGRLIWKIGAVILVETGKSFSLLKLLTTVTLLQSIL